MRRFLIRLVTAIGLTGGLPAAPQGADPAIGMVIQADGQVVIQRGTQKSAARIADLLYPGDTIVTSAGKALLMYCPSSERLVISQNSAVELGAGGWKLLKGQSPQRSPGKCRLPQVALGAESLERVGTFRARGYPPLTLYLGGPVTSQRPTFLWGTLDGAADYHVVVKDPDRDVIVWETRTTSATCPYPQSIEPLKAGEYEWQVQAQSGGRILAEGRARFEVRPSTESSHPPGGAEDVELQRALELESAGYYAEAATLFRRLRQESPKDARLARHLAWLYWNAGLIEAFNEEWKRLDAR
jgi:hypothetical protein